MKREGEQDRERDEREMGPHDVEDKVTGFMCQLQHLDW